MLSMARIQSGDQVLPTHSCFDDALRFFALWPNLVARNNALIVHGICIGSDAGVRYAHAWVEVDDAMHGRAVCQSGMLDGETFFMLVAVEDYYVKMNVHSAYKYSFVEAIVHTVNEGIAGPWEQELKELMDARSGDGRAIVGQKNYGKTVVMLQPPLAVSVETSELVTADDEVQAIVAFLRLNKESRERVFDETKDLPQYIRDEQ